MRFISATCTSPGDEPGRHSGSVPAAPPAARIRLPPHPPTARISRRHSLSSLFVHRCNIRIRRVFLSFECEQQQYSSGGSEQHGGSGDDVSRWCDQWGESVFARTHVLLRFPASEWKSIHSRGEKEHNI